MPCDYFLVIQIYLLENWKEKMTSRYKMFLRLCESWPLDKSKSGRDLAVVIRQEVAKAFHEGEATPIDDKVCKLAYDSLSRINTNHNKTLYALPGGGDIKGCTGLALEQCGIVTSSEGLTAINE